MLLAITPGDGRDLRPWLELLLRCEIRHVLLREPGRNVLPLVSFCNKHFDSVWVHEGCADAQVSWSTGAGAHFRSDTRPSHSGLFTQSAHTPEDVERSLTADASWVLYSPVWSPGSKPNDTRPVLGLDHFLAIAKERPVLALGGLSVARYRHLIRCGASGGAATGMCFRGTLEEAEQRLAGLRT